MTSIEALTAAETSHRNMERQMRGLASASTSPASTVFTVAADTYQAAAESVAALRKIEERGTK